MKNELRGRLTKDGIRIYEQSDFAGMHVAGALAARILDDIVPHVFVGQTTEEIDRINILAATMCAMQRAVADLPQTPQAVLIDGNRAPTLPMTCQAIVKGDAKSLSIAAASIIAKTTRDRLMIAADTRFSGYGHAGHKGYPTKAHRQTLLTTGASPIHRRSFGPVRDVTGKPINLP